MIFFLFFFFDVLCRVRTGVSEIKPLVGSVYGSTR